MSELVATRILQHAERLHLERQRRVAADPAAPGPVPGRLRGTHLPPQAQLRGGPVQAQGHPGCQDLGAHLKRNYGAGRSRLKGTQGARIWENWSVLAYDLDTVARLPIRRGSR